MRANTKKKHKMGRRFAILIGVAAAGVMALGAQTGTAASEGVVEYKTTLTIYKDGAELHGEVKSGVRECWEGREVIVFKKRPGADRKLGATRSGPQAKSHNWRFWVKVANKEANEKVLRDGDVYAKVTPKVGDGFVCRADTSGMLWKTYPPSMRTTGDPVDSTPPDLQLSGPKKQSPQKQGLSRVRCLTAICTTDLRRGCPGELWRRGVHRTRHGEADERQDGQARPGRPRRASCRPGRDRPTSGRSWRSEGAAQAGPPGARRGRERQGEGHRQGDGCGRQRGDREAHDHTRQVGTTGSRAWRLGTSQAPRVLGACSRSLCRVAGCAKNVMA